MESVTNNKANRLTIKKLIILLAVIILLAIIVEAAISLFVLRLDQKDSCNQFLNQVEDVLERNEEEEASQLAELKDTYMTAAKAAAYILSDKPEVRDNVSEMKYIAELLSVDELHVFDETGTIIAGTNPEYYGYSFDSGEQMAYFKPMLEDRTLSMCQDVTPNTAENKSMMYAITWDENGKYMIQVGVEPVRLIEMLKDHEITKVINSIPITEGYEIYAVDIEKDTVIASSNENSINMKLDAYSSIKRIFGHDGSHGFCHYGSEWLYADSRVVDNYVIGVTYDLKYSNNSLLVPIMIVFVFLIIAGTAIILVVSGAYKIEDENNAAIMKQYGILSSMADIYFSVHMIDLEKNTVEEYKSQGVIDRVVTDHNNASLMMNHVMRVLAEPEYVDKAVKFTDLKTIAARIGNRKIVSTEIIGRHVGWFLASFIVLERNESGEPVKLIFTTQNIDKSKKKEEKLLLRSRTDELTGCLNRRAYEESISKLEKKGISDSFIYISIDVNGLKATNDNLGHEAGDELIIGASECMIRTFKRYGDVFRTGGDEFAAFIEADKKQLAVILAKLDRETEKWYGSSIDHLSLSYGYIVRADYPDASIHEIAVMADKKMYEAKSRFYRAKGMDRRGQQDAHKALCGLYTKILRINLTDDSYQIVNMDAEEQTEAMGFSDRISDWLSGFGRSGQVHPDDLDEYLKKTDMDYMSSYFADRKAALHIFYRRKYGDDYRRVMMEIIPAEDYTPEYQSLFLYVKDID